MLNVPKLSYAILLVLAISGCSKNEKAIEQSIFTSLQLKAITADALMLQVKADENVLTDSFYTPGNKAVPVTYFNPTKRFRVTDLFSKTLLLDTLVDYKPGAINTLTFFQAVSGGKLVRIGPPANEPLPTGGKIKISVVYGIEELPDIIKAVVEDSETGGSVYSVTDSFLLKKGEFSPYFIGKMISNRKPQLKFYTADANRKLIAKSEPGILYDLNADFTIYSLKKDGIGLNTGIIELGREKLY
jgi:hypothetical protein